MSKANFDFKITKLKQDEAGYLERIAKMKGLEIWFNQTLDKCRDMVDKGKCQYKPAWDGLEVGLLRKLHSSNLKDIMSKSDKSISELKHINAFIDQGQNLSKIDHKDIEYFLALFDVMKDDAKIMKESMDMTIFSQKKRRNNRLTSYSALPCL